MEYSTPEETRSPEEAEPGESDRLNAASGSDDPAETPWFSRDVFAQGTLLLTAVGTAWFPIEGRPLVAIPVALVVLGLITWGWRRSSLGGLRGLCIAGCVLILLICSAFSGWDPSRAVGELGLILSAAALVWLASRSRAPASFPMILAFGLSALSVWGISQAVFGLEVLLPGLEALPEAARAYAEERVAGRRAFASLPLPSHLAVLLATALPLLVTRMRATPEGMVATLGVGLAAAGLVATRSPVGIGLALLAVVAVVMGSNRRHVFFMVGLLVVMLVSVVMIRSDVARLEPVALRVDNWRVGLWSSQASPVCGVGLSGFAQASQAVPLVVGNRPAHAHNLPLEALAELGPVGLAGCLALALGLLRLLVVLWRRDRALAAALAVVPLHNLLDFSFFVSGVALPWAVLLGWGIARRGSPRVASRQIRGRLAVVVAASIAVAGTTLHATSVLVEETAATEPEAELRFDGALRALRLAPWRVEPQFLLASAALDMGDTSMVDRAWDELARHRWWRPRSAALAERRAHVALARGDVSAAAAELWAAEEEGPPDAQRTAALADLLTALERGAHGPPG